MVGQTTQARSGGGVNLHPNKGRTARSSPTHFSAEIRYGKFEVPIVTRKASGKLTLPRPPAYLGVVGKRWWREVVAQYALETHDLTLLAAACHCLDRIEAARELLKSGGLVVKDRFDQDKMHPAILIERDNKALPVEGKELLLATIDESTRADGSRFGGCKAYWTHEASEATDTKPAFGAMLLPLHKLLAFCYTSDEMLEDVVGLGEYLTDVFSRELVFNVENAIINGTGAGQPLGILNSDCLITVAAEGSQTATTIWGDNALAMMARLWGASLPNAVWLTNQDCLKQLLKATGKGEYTAATYAGAPLVTFHPASPYPLLLGKPVIPVEYASTLGTVGDLILADLSQYTIAERPLASNVSMDLRFLYHESAFRIRWRLNGQPVWSSAVTPLNGSATASPFVALATRA